MHSTADFKQAISNRLNRRDIMKYYFSIIDIYPYLLLFAIIFKIINSRKTHNQLKKIFFVVLFFMGIRYGVGYDYFSYKEAIITSDQSFEPLAQMLCEFSRETHYQLFFIISSLLVLYPVYKVSQKYSINPILSFMVYMLIPMLFLDGMSTVRNAVAYPMVLWAFMILLREKRRYLAIIPLLIAIGFHRSSIIALAILPLAFFSFKRKYVVIAWIVSFMFAQGQIADALLEYLGVPFWGRASWYLLKAEENDAGRTLWLAVNAINIINFYYWKKLTALNNENQKFLSVYTLGCILYNLTISIEPTIALRLSNFCSIFLMLVVPYYIYVLPWREKTNRRLVYLFFIFYFSSLLFTVILGTPPDEKMSYFPYQTIFYHTDYVNLQ